VSVRILFASHDRYWTVTVGFSPILVLQASDLRIASLSGSLDSLSDNSPGTQLPIRAMASLEVLWTGGACESALH
jgi:hypothetical protein